MGKLGIGGEGSGTVVKEPQREEAVVLVTEVLQISLEQSRFFLESANFDLAVAIDLYFEFSGTQDSGNSASKRTRDNSYTGW